MVGARKGAKRTRHGARNWILKALASAESSGGMATRQIRAKVASLSGAKIPDYSLYQALRTLVRQGAVASKRRGRELWFTMSSATASTGRSIRKAARRAPAETVAPVDVPAGATVVAESVQVMHKLAPGEVVILHVGEEHIESATNQHGKLVLERHRRPAN